MIHEKHIRQRYASPESRQPDTPLFYLLTILSRVLENRHRIPTNQFICESETAALFSEK